ncbi:CPW-WPC family protein, putative [Plasmodium chabaudi chabaudi]|uniref:CPW-WPC family protein, putative n=1 Tax=Plasmodium chabaudi chabaudi TaxID=31271 RepID=A0A1D3LIN4_PLACU|nr:CPW-WPC family protein, putative [Plasmodium chabaudi chabaudi]
MARLPFVLLVALVCVHSFFFTCTVHNKNDSKSENILSSNGILKNIVKHSPKISEDEINESTMKIVKKAHEDENKILEKIGACQKDYTLPCPKYWEQNQKIMNNEKIITCTANNDYEGFCEKYQSFTYFTEEDKMNFELSCNVEWECKNLNSTCPSGKRDYSEPCPIGFIAQNDNSCKADITIYNGMCNSDNINFNHMNNSEKNDWSIACGAYWECYKECQSNEIFSNCPKNWKEINKYDCIPNEKYKGPCKGKHNFQYYTKIMKIEFEEICKTKFVCKQNCQKNYEQEDCPIDWEKQNGYCLAPTSFNLCNKKKLSIENLTINDKIKFEKECLVNWACKKNEDGNSFCQMDWSYDCPYDWIRQKNNESKKYICKSNSSNYNGKCKDIILEHNSNEVTKRKIASSCHTPWPCIDKKLIPFMDTSNQYNTKQNNDKNKINGPVTQKGDIYNQNPYHIIDTDKDLADFDILS